MLVVTPEAAADAIVTHGGVTQMWYLWPWFWVGP